MWADHLHGGELRPTLSQLVPHGREGPSLVGIVGTQPHHTGPGHRFVQSDDGEWTTSISEGAEGWETYVTWDESDQDVIVQDATYDVETRPEMDTDLEGEEQFKDWARVVHRRALAAMGSYTHNAVPEGFADQAAAFAAGNPDPAAAEPKTHRERYAADLGHALSGYLDAGEDAEESTHNIGYAFAGIRHWCKANGCDFDAALATGMESFEADEAKDQQLVGA